MEIGEGNLAALGLIVAFLLYRASKLVLKRRTSVRRRAPAPETPRRPQRRFEPIRGKPRVIDGDTIRIGRSRIRLFGMDAPEMSQAGGAQSRDHLSRLIEGRIVVAQPVAIDVYKRLVARVWLGGTDISAKMVLDGYAIAMQDWHRDYTFHEKAARREGCGLWSDDPVNGITCPSRFRLEQNSQRQGPLPSETAAPDEVIRPI